MIERYTRPEMAAIWQDENRFRIWLDIELLAMEAMVRQGWIPADALARVRKKAAFDIPRIDEIERKVKHDVIAFLTSVSEHIGEDSRFLHVGMTSSDVLDTSFAVQMRQALTLLMAAWQKPHVRERISGFLHPDAHAAAEAYQSNQSVLSIGSGGPFGRGLGQGLAKYGYLPDAHTDFIFSVMGEELGFIGCAAVLGTNDGTSASDWYRFSASAGQGVSLAASGPTESIELYLVDSAGNPVAMGLRNEGPARQSIEIPSMPAAPATFSRNA